MIGNPLSMTLDDPVSDAISFRLTTSFGKDGSEVLCIILIMPEEDVKVDPNLLDLMINTNPFFQTCFLHVCSRSQLVLRNKFYQVKLWM
jgi:hypothetical protein